MAGVIKFASLGNYVVSCVDPSFVDGQATWIHFAVILQEK
jgi:hypothetical protein